jgi:hypothetical protein
MLRMVSLKMETPHGVNWYGGKLWVLAAESSAAQDRRRLGQDPGDL